MSLMMDDTVTNDALVAKIITMLCLFAISMAVGVVPLLLSLKFDWLKASDPNLRSSNQLVMGLLAFGGGVLFATTFMHLLPEVDENIEHLQDLGELPDLPIFFAGLIMCGGFFMMYLIEELVHLYINRRESKKIDTNFTKPFILRKESSISSTVAELPVESKEKDAEKDQNQKGHSHLMVEDDDTVVSALRGLLIVLALSIHELFEGLAVGLEASVANVCWTEEIANVVVWKRVGKKRMLMDVAYLILVVRYMFGAVSAHKYIIAFCIGVELLVSGTKRWLSIVYIFTFSFMSALGIGIGILLVGGAGAADAGVYSVVLQGLACGTLVYVVFFEVWKRSNGFLQFVCSLLGFVLMVILEVAVEMLA